ncbi:LysR family transcriptional regulator [Rhodococcus opacus]|uniref:Putative LysR family transcriptional regulator n=1 Tax=Rhodococcus opacus (strain B4) TaxID=632772 RepID=C1B5W8_RHOOB|nr:LysR family transcriptional regulator [Rhodococcus opacus]BAH55379.1 putative LysR family transcriptional regulator [Rhodococcus opacus B4]
MEIQQLRCLVAVAEHGSFTKAAAAVHLTQPSLSHAVAKLESELRMQLFHRSSRGVTFTPAGHSILEPARRVLSALDDIDATVSSLRGMTEGTVRVVSTRSFTASIADAVSEFRRQFPQMKVTVGASRTESEVHALIASGDCDIAFARVDRTPPELSADVLDVESLAAIVPRRHDPHPDASDITWPQAAELPLIVPPVGNQARLALDRVFAAHDARMTVAVENEDYESTLEMVRAGVGACLGTQGVSRLPNGARMKTIIPVSVTKIGLVYRPGTLAPAVSAFRMIALQSFSGRYQERTPMAANS